MRTMLVASMLVLVVPGVLWAQQPKPELTEAEQKAQAAALAKETQNPVADLNTIPVQFNWNTGGGLGDQTLQIINVQPVLPLPINKTWNIVSRTVVPIVNAPLPSGDRSTGIGDIQEQLFLSKQKSGKVIWGIGPILSFPTATNGVLETGQFALGPTAVVLTMPGHWVIGVLANNMWRIAGSSDTEIGRAHV